MRLAFSARKAAKAPVMGVVHLASGLHRADALEDLLLADRHRGGGAAIGHDVERAAGQDHVGCGGDPRFHGAQRLGRDLGIVEDAALIEGDAGKPCHDGAPFMLDGEVGGEHQEAEPGPAGDAVIGLEGQVLDQDHAVVGLSRCHVVHARSP